MFVRIKQSGISLIEVILYIGLVSVMLVSITSMMFYFFDSQIKNRSISEVEQNGVQIMNIITQAIRNADSIVLPNLGESATSLTLDVPNNTNDTVFDLNNTKIEVVVDGNSAVNLNSDRLIASNFQVYNYGQANTNGVIRVEFTLSYINSSGRNSYDYSQIFYGGATIR